MAIPNVHNTKTIHQNTIHPLTFSIFINSTKPIDNAKEPKTLEPYKNFKYCFPLTNRKPNPKKVYKINKNARPLEIFKENRITKVVNAFRRIVLLLTKCGSPAIPYHIVIPAIIISATTGSNRGTL